MIPAKKFGAKSITYLAYTDVMHSLCRLSSLVVLLKATCVYFLSIKAEKDFRQVCLRVMILVREVDAIGPYSKFKLPSSNLSWHGSNSQKDLFSLVNAPRIPNSRRSSTRDAR